jgi:PleD family two-component response regulator
MRVRRMKKAMEIREETSARINSNKVPRKSILVIDDSADILALLRTILEIDDYEIFTAQSGTGHAHYEH